MMIFLFAITDLPLLPRKSLFAQNRVLVRRHADAPHHSITSSARASSVGGTSMPSAVAVTLTKNYSVASAAVPVVRQDRTLDDACFEPARSEVLGSRQLSRKLLRILDRLGCLSFLSALASIWRMRSRVTENCRPTSSSVWSLFTPMPKRMRIMRSSRGVRE